MTDYAKATNFAAKDSLASGNPLKVVKGTEIDDEFEAIETAIGTKANLASPTFTGTPTAPTAAVGTNNTQIATTAFVQVNGVPSGVITMWSGSVASIPSGWYLCDGTNSTPDLRNRFVVGAGDTYSVDATGGSASSVASHTHTITVDQESLTGTIHTDDQSTSTGVFDGGVISTAYNSSTGSEAPRRIHTLDASHNHTATASSTGTSDGNLPPYYALAYIMKA